jgi:predicted ferric reductase
MASTDNHSFNEFYNWPAFIAFVLFIVNNFWLKLEYHNWLTGKLSDLLFCFFFPLYVSAMLAAVSRLGYISRVVIGVVLTLALMVGMKTSSAFSSYFSEFFSVFTQMVAERDSVNIVDPTDLIVTPVVIFSVVIAVTKGKEKKRAQ